MKVILARRQKQIDYGKNTACYAKYRQDVPRSKRTKAHPSTPNKYINNARRGWDMLIKIWRKKLHYWDPTSEPSDTAADAPTPSSEDVHDSEEDAAPEAVACDDDDFYIDITPTTSSADVRDSEENAAAEAAACDDEDFYIDVNAESDDEL